MNKNQGQKKVNNTKKFGYCKMKNQKEKDFYNKKEQKNKLQKMPQKK